MIVFGVECNTARYRVAVEFACLTESTAQRLERGESKSPQSKF